MFLCLSVVFLLSILNIITYELIKIGMERSVVYNINVSNKINDRKSSNEC